ncbi:hypothetical protein [Aquidulcibacter sp.]|uniref:hypothetical protein n=1 Tax=Aquidulcibacter sp. TaxID=2052990 RepID=UPI0025BE6F89|nr:hypothetical protein [Aquidulcibacter sp.]MCA3694573.1 hypothetical protein [Aquidulcibacter sp.]
MWVFALLAAGFGSSAPTEAKEKEVAAVVPDVTIEREMVPPPSTPPDKHFFEPNFSTSPKTRSYMVITPVPPRSRSLANQEGGRWLEPPGGWVSPDVKTKPFRVEPLEKPKPKMRILRGGNG